MQQLLRERAEDDGVGVRYGDMSWTWREHLAERGRRGGRASSRLADPDRPLHVGVLLGNTPDMLRAMAAAALGGYVLCGINTTRRGRRAARRRTPRGLPDVLVTDGEHRRPRSTGLDLAGVRVVDVDSRRVGRAGGGRRAADAARRGRRDGHVHDDLHLGHQRRAQGRPGAAHLARSSRGQPGRPLLAHRRRRLLRLDAAVPLQRGRRRLGGRGRAAGAAIVAGRGSRRPGSSTTSATTARRT